MGPSLPLPAMAVPVPTSTSLVREKHQYPDKRRPSVSLSDHQAMCSLLAAATNGGSCGSYDQGVISKEEVESRGSGTNEKTDTYDSKRLFHK